MPEIAVFIGDKEGRFFTGKSSPFKLPPGVEAKWSSIYVLGGDKVVVAATTTIKGKEGIWLSFGNTQVK